METQELNLRRAEINSFKGIDSSSPIVLDLGKNYDKGKNIMAARGNQGTGKTSTLEALLYLFGSSFEFSKENLINATDETLNAGLEFEYEGDKYRIKATKDKFSLQVFIADKKGKPGEGRWLDEKKPKETIQKWFGPLGISPMFLKGLEGEKQIKWFRETFSGDGEDGYRKEQNLLSKIDKIAKERREKNRELTMLNSSLATNPIFRNIDAIAAKYPEAPNVETVKKAYNEAQEAAKDYNLRVEGIPKLKNDLKTLDEEEKRIMEKYQADMEEIKRKRDLYKNKIVEGDKYISENFDVPQKLQDAEQRFMTISEQVVEYKELESVRRNIEITGQMETEVQKYDNDKEKALDELQKLTKKYLPEIEGLEIRIPKGLDSDVVPGIYYDNKTLAQLSESELYALFFKIWELKNVRFVFIENLSSLGTDAIAVLNDVAQKGVKVFYSEMNRKQQEIKITFQDKID